MIEETLVADQETMKRNDRKSYNRIKVVLAEKGLKSKFLVQALDVNVTTVSRWCTNQMQPRVETLFDIADALDVEVRHLLVSSRS